MAEVSCLQCGTAFHVDIAAACGKEQRFSYRVYPEEQSMMQAATLGGQLKALDDLMRACAREDGGKVRTYVEKIVTHDDASIEFFLIVLPVVAWDADKQRFVNREPDKTSPMVDRNV